MRICSGCKKEIIGKAYYCDECRAAKEERGEETSHSLAIDNKLLSLISDLICQEIEYDNCYISAAKKVLVAIDQYIAAQEKILVLQDIKGANHGRPPSEELPCVCPNCQHTFYLSQTIMQS
jgi:hypothetical protein